MSNIDFTYESSNIFEDTLKDHDREDRMIKSDKARAKRKIIKDKKNRAQARGFKGTLRSGMDA